MFGRLALSGRWRHAARRASGSSSAIPDAAPKVLMADFAYDLPASRIAAEPAKPRGASKLLVALPELGAPRREAAQATRKRLRNLTSLTESLRDHVDMRFADLVNLLPSNTHLVFNESRVLPARMFARCGGREEPVEVMFLGPEEPSSDPVRALASGCDGQVWRCMVRSDSSQVGDRLRVVGTLSDDTEHKLALQIVSIQSSWQEEGEEDGIECSVRFELGDHRIPAEQVFEQVGHIPLPPYMERGAVPEDGESYQTVYASRDATGSVAAPTAGLHFTPELLARLDAAGMARSGVVLHVGAGTFRPVVSERIDAHAMHEERFSVTTEMLRGLVDSLRTGRCIVPVGTTSSRCLESLYWLGVKASRAEQPPPEWSLRQWEPYAMAGGGGAGGARTAVTLPSAAEALQSLITVVESSGETAVSGVTSLCIAPGYSFRLCDALVTNFHMPDSTLMLLVGALAGGTRQLQQIYRHALRNDYRFLSYGDACLIFNAQPPLQMEEGDVAKAASSLAQAVQELKGQEQMRVLLHSCCAPCSGAMIEEMQSQGLDVTVFFYNPNIHPRKEYDIRKEENKRYAEKLGVPFVDSDYDVDEWYQRAEGMEYAPERGARCTMCFDMRFERTALHAHEHGFTHFTTTNATSRWKDQAQVNASGLRAAARYPGVEYVVYDWQTEAMSERKYRINAEEAFYKQEYCGCSYSLRDSNAYRKREGISPVVIGGGGVYSDPLADSAEESPEIVDSFFSDAGNTDLEARRQQQERLYRQRRKSREGGNAANNW